MASTDEAAYIAWSDARATGRQGDAEDAYVSRLRFVADGEPATGPASGSRWLWTITGAGGALCVAGAVLILGVRRQRDRLDPSTRPA